MLRETVWTYTKMFQISVKTNYFRPVKVPTFFE